MMRKAAIIGMAVGRFIVGFACGSIVYYLVFMK